MDEELEKKTNFNFGDFYRKNRYKIFSAIIFLVVIVFVVIIFNEYKKNNNINISNKYNKAKILIENKKKQEAKKILEELIFKKNSFYSPSALNLIVDNNLIKDKKKILDFYDQIINNTKLDTETKNLFIFKKIIFMGDSIEENELLSNLKPIIKSESLWKNTILDYIKKFYLAKGEFKKAKEFEILVN